VTVLLVALMLSKIVLSFAFAAAGTAKLADRAASRTMLTAFGVPARLTSWLAIALPLTEIVAAAGLLVPASAWSAGIGTTLLLLGFTAAIAYNLANGRRPNCNCFGQIQSGPIGAWTIGRNGILTVLAILVVAVGPGQAGAWSLFGASPMAILAVALSAVCAVSVGLNAVLLRNVNRQRREIRDLAAKKPVLP
jgi:uncharacterized membrane protein YphA (DoxX/SURF4 family)